MVFVTNSYMCINIPLPDAPRNVIDDLVCLKDTQYMVQLVPAERGLQVTPLRFDMSFIFWHILLNYTTTCLLLF